MLNMAVIQRKADHIFHLFFIYGRMEGGLEALTSVISVDDLFSERNHDDRFF